MHCEVPLCGKGELPHLVYENWESAKKPAYAARASICYGPGGHGPQWSQKPMRVNSVGLVAMQGPASGLVSQAWGPASEPKDETVAGDETDKPVGQGWKAQEPRALAW